MDGYSGMGRFGNKGGMMPLSGYGQFEEPNGGYMRNNFGQEQMMKRDYTQVNVSNLQHRLKQYCYAMMRTKDRIKELEEEIQEQIKNN